jgi:hypothetical protein
MRLVQGRGYWEPRHKIEGLTRYAFLGDSYVFGPGVGAMETLPARAERHLNESAGGRLFEAVNLGVNGYNLWNAWLAFNRMPQIYDGVVLSLCNNDAQLFERTLRIDYGGMTTPYWEADHPFRGAIEACFDDVAACSTANALPVAVCYNTLWPTQPGAEWPRKLAEIVAALCAARGIPFIDFPAHLAERNIAFDELVLDPADYHPSKLAHDADARYLVQSLRARGWLEGGGEIAGTPDRILDVARKLIAQDAYPRDVAWRWADAALASKRASARRASANMADFTAAADTAAAEIAVAHRSWQREAKTAAVLVQASSLREGASLALNYVDEDALRLEELGYVLMRPDWQAMANALPAAPIRGASVPRLQLREAEALLCSVIDDMVRFASETEISDPDAAALRDLAGRAQRKAEDFLSQMTTLSSLLASTESEQAGLPELLHDVVSRGAYHLDEVRKRFLWTRSTASLIDDETTVEVRLATNAIEGRKPGLVDVWASSLAPRRPPMKNQRQFLNTGETTLIRLKLPLFYAGQLMVAIQIPPAIADRATAELVSLDVYNGEGPRRTLARDAFSPDALGRLISPNLFLL